MAAFSFLAAKICKKCIKTRSLKPEKTRTKISDKDETFRTWKNIIIVFTFEEPQVTGI